MAGVSIKAKLEYSEGSPDVLCRNGITRFHILKGHKIGQFHIAIWFVEGTWVVKHQSQWGSTFGMRGKRDYNLHFVKVSFLIGFVL